MNLQLHGKLAEIENMINDKVMHGENDQEKLAYNMLKELAKEIQQLLIDTEEIVIEPSCKGILLNYQSEGEAIIEETLEILNEMIEMPFKVLIGKKLYEVLEDQMADLDDWIEIVNEALEHTGKSFTYIEAWDIGIFLENH